METPSSTRRVTRSMAATSASASNNSLLSKKYEGSEKTARQTSSKNQNKHKDRSALVDITNDSPIVGLAVGTLKTPSSAMSKKRVMNPGQAARTPGSGEALLRGQVKTLLQRVEEEAEVSKIMFEDRPFFNLQGLVRSQVNLLAPTPANTPQVLNFSDAYDLSSLISSPVSEKLLIPQMINEIFDEKEKDSEDLITRSLMLDFSDKSEMSDSSYCSSVLTHERISELGAESDKEKLSTDDDDASIWSIQVNLSSPRIDDNEYGNEEDGGEGLVEEEEDDDDEYEYHEEDGGVLDDLCEGMSKISVEEGPKFAGKHIRFLYDSDDEIQGEEEVGRCEHDDAEFLS